MKKLSIRPILSLFVFNFTFGQNHEKYAELIKDAWNLYQAKEYLESGQKYAQAFIVNGGKGLIADRYNAACSWALANQTDSAFINLFKIAESGYYTNLEHITSDPDLNSLHKDERWTKVIEIVKLNKEKVEANFDKPLVVTLDTIFQEDQKYWLQIDETEKKYGWESDEMKALFNIIKEKDSINLIKVRKILDERGWLGPDIIGNQGNLTLFLVIQHADIETQEKYLPMMREAVKKGNTTAANLALLEDRVALRKGEKQIYGSQVGRNQETGEYYVSPLIDPDNVDKRRKEVGLGTMQEYISNWGMTWDVEEYKRKLAEYEAKQKE